MKLGEISLIIDFHCHLGGSFLSSYLLNESYGVKELIEEMDKCGVRMACISGGGKPNKVASSNKLVLNAVKKYKDRLIGFIRVNPWMKDYLEKIDKLVSLGFRGIKLHPMQDAYCPLLEPRLDLILEKAAKYKLPVLIHSGTDPWTMPGQISDLAERFPEVSFVMGHSCMNTLYQHLLPSVLKRENMYVETSIHGGIIWRKYIDVLEERVLFGSNWPTQSMKAEIIKIMELDLPKRIKEKILGINALKLLGIDVEK